MRVEVNIKYNDWGQSLTYKNSYKCWIDADIVLSPEEERNIVSQKVPLSLIQSYEFKYPKFANIQVGDEVVLHNGMEYSEKFHVKKREDMRFILSNGVKVSYDGDILSPAYRKCSIYKN